MRDPTLLAATLHAIRDAGVALRAPPDAPEPMWRAGSVPLNAQAVRDLVEDVWLKRDAYGGRLVIDAWPGFAGDDPSPGPSGDARQTRPERVFSRREADDE